MGVHEITFSDVVKARSNFAGIEDIKTLAKRTRISEATLRRHMADSDWSRDQLIELHRVLHFTARDMGVFLGAKLSKEYESDEAAAEILQALDRALKNYKEAVG